jgi:hypothetical protein
MDPHPLVDGLAKALKAQARDPAVTTGTPQALALAANLPELVIFAGYAGAVVKQPSIQTEWQVLYLDPRLARWMLVEQERILTSIRLEDDRSPDGGCDYVWLETETPVGSGTSAQSVETAFLTGPFVRAGDFEAPSGGGANANTGMFCEARTPFCCRRYSRS